MLTLVETISLAGDRAKQNDDAFGLARQAAWVIDGATDLDAPLLKNVASDAAWFAQNANRTLHEVAGASGDVRGWVRSASEAAARDFARLHGSVAARWQSPIASMLLVSEKDNSITGLDLGDCRIFALGADGLSIAIGGPPGVVDNETAMAAKQTDAHKPLLERTETIARLRRDRGALNCEGAHWTLCLDPDCARQARTWRLEIARPGYALLCTDGFAALVDRYRTYEPGALVQAALEKGLQELGRELRAIETGDESSTQHPRYKKSDDATAVLLRCT